MSWFTQGIDKLTEFKGKIQEAIPVNKEMLAKLTLNTDEMKAERLHFGEEANRKSEVKDMLAGMLPWETRDSERDILVEECKEAILALSSKDGTFFGPYEMPLLNVITDDNEQKSEGDEEEEVETSTAMKDFKPTQESLEKLAKLEPLPPLLHDFDLDAHVGLIQKLLAEDSVLVQKQSTLSGGGQREKVFWHNYFFHCAYTRYEAGLSIDEIWSYNPDEAKKEEDTEEVEEAAEETVIFDETAAEAEEAPSEHAFAAEPSDEPDSPVAGSSNLDYGATADTSPSDSVTNDYEVVDDDYGDSGSGDPELDALEAEIARELED